MNQKGYTFLLIILIIVAISGYLVYSGKANLNQAKPASKPNVVDETISWNNMSKNFFYADSSVEKELNQCSENNLSTLGMNDCYGVAMKKYDAILDRVYELTLQDLAEARVADEKRFFAQYRDTTCSIAYEEAKGGSIQGLLGGACYLQVTRAQIQTLCSLGAGPSRCEGKIQL